MIPRPREWAISSSDASFSRTRAGWAGSRRPPCCLPRRRPREAADQCLFAEPPAATAAPAPLRFGITPQLAGTVGSAQGAVEPEDPAARAAALAELRPRGRALVIRLNRLFMSAGRRGNRDLRGPRPPLRAQGLPRRGAGSLPPGARARGRHRRLATVRTPGGEDARRQRIAGRPLDHQRGQPAALREHLRRRLRRRTRRDRDRDPDRGAGAAPPRPRRRRPRVHLRVPVSAGRRRAVLDVDRRAGERRLPCGARLRRRPALSRPCSGRRCS